MSESKKIQHPWAVLAVMYVVAFSAPMNLFKFSAIVPLVMQTVGVDQSGFGLLMSAFTFIAIILAFPIASITRKFGCKMTMMVACIISAIGALICCFSTSFGVLMFARFLEGVGMSAAGNTTITLAVGALPEEKRGAGVGLMASNVAFGSFLCYVLFAALGDAYGFSCVMWVAFIFNVICIPIGFIGLKDPEFKEPAQGQKKVSMWKVLGEHKQFFLLLIGFFCFNVVIVGVINNFATDYLTSGSDAFSFTLSMAGLIAALSAVVSTLVQIIIGRISDKTGSKPWLIVGSITGLIVAICYFSAPSIPVLCIAVFCQGCTGGLLACQCQTVGPGMLGAAEHAPIAQGCFGFSQNLGQFLGSTVFGVIVVSLGYKMAGWVMLVPLFIICLIAMIFVKLPKREALQAPAED